MATALVTGGTSGIGAAFARVLAQRGDDLVLVARDTERLQQMAAELMGRHGVQVDVLTADLGDAADTERIADRLRSSESPIDLLVNNAGFGVHTALTSADTAAHQHAFDVMCRAVLVLGAAAGRSMADRGRGAIINVSSGAAYLTMGSYSAIKAWALSYSEGLAVELADRGVTVTGLCPGWVRTEFHERAGIGTSKIPEWMWLSAEDLVAEALADSAAGKVISIPSKRYRVLLFFARHAPRSVIRRVSGRISSSRRSG
jgi:uncharacterized protein